MPSSKKQQITPSVSVTPASAPSSSANQQNQKPFTITVTSVPGKLKKQFMIFIRNIHLQNLILGSSKGNSSSLANTNSGLAALQNMALGGGASASLSSANKDTSLNALFAQAAQADTQAFIKQQQKLLQQLPANSPQRKSYEAIFAEMKQAADYNR